MVVDVNTKHNIVCWGPYAIPVPEKMKWIAWDKCGDVSAFEKEPIRLQGYWTIDCGDAWLVDCAMRLPPPEPGEWTEQLYYLEDM